MGFLFSSGFSRLVVLATFECTSANSLTVRAVGISVSMSGQAFCRGFAGVFQGTHGLGCFLL